MDNVQRVHDFMKDAGYYFMLTVDEEGYPKGRAFTSKIVYDGKLYIITGNAKRVYKQIVSNPKVEILAYQMKNQEYMRVDATAVISEDTVIKEAYLEKEPQVRGDFEGDAVPQMGLFFLKDASVEILTLDGMVKEAFHFNG
mgnify:CR=1 FL=1